MPTLRARFVDTVYKPLFARKSGEEWLLWSADERRLSTVVLCLKQQGATVHFRFRFSRPVLAFLAFCYVTLAAMSFLTFRSLLEEGLYNPYSPLLAIFWGAMLLASRKSSHEMRTLLQKVTPLQEVSRAPFSDSTS